MILLIWVEHLLLLDSKSIMYFFVKTEKFWEIFLYTGKFGKDLAQVVI